MTLKETRKPKNIPDYLPPTIGCGAAAQLNTQMKQNNYTL
jgi:hypothetical protein